MNHTDLTLLIDCSSANVQWGVASNDIIIDKEYLNRESNADSLISKIKSSFENRSLNFSSIKFVILANGPGSFTGLRIGSAIAKGVCFVLHSKLIEVNSLDVLAGKSTSSGKVICLISSKMKSGEFYAAEYNKGSETIRTSDYNIILPNEIPLDVRVIVAEDIHCSIQEKEVVGTETIDELLKIGIRKIHKEEFSDIFTSEPFYIKKFEAVIKNKDSINGMV